MPNACVLRLYVYVCINTTPLTLEISFPRGREKLAQHYRDSIRGVKPLPQEHQKTLSVVSELPPSAKSIDTGKGVHSLVVHFDHKENADAWTDAICQPVRDHERQVIVKQYWKENELEELERKLEEQKQSKPPEVSRNRREVQDRAGTPPRGARGSSRQHRS
ncbi:hypothetical protein QQZ08_008877 [Neonectria magnoliae]|uniref:Uncharacterized protein n=1 Tax=Neonectria magnoliae TaxID=2732573 RepID=A0ABR1HRI3_9HYPO